MAANPIWHNSYKNPEVCTDCPHVDETCVLTGRRTVNTPYSLIFLFEAPDESACEHNVTVSSGFGGSPQSMLRALADKCKEKFNFVLNPSVLFAVGAHSRTGLTKGAVDSCQPYVHAKLAEIADKRPDMRHVIVAFGSNACKSLNLRFTKIDKVRGHVKPTRVGQHTFHVIPTLSIRQCLVRPNYFKLVFRDVTESIAALFADKPLLAAEEIGKDYLFPETPQDIGDLVDYVINYTGKASVHPDEWPIALDFETTGLLPWAANARIIAISVSWDEGKAATILLDHKDNPQDPAEIWPHVLRLLDCRKKTIWHNGLFDYLWMWRILGRIYGNLWWDTMLGEHFLNEDAKGYYSLKRVLLEYAPQFAGYEDALWRLVAKDTKKNLSKLVKYTSAPKLLVEHATDLFELEAEYVFITFELFTLKDDLIDENGNPIAEHVELRKSRQKEKSKLRSRIRKIYKDHGFPPPANASVTVQGKKNKNANNGEFERVPIPVMSLYAAIDSDLTRRCCKGQRDRMLVEDVAEDGARVMRDLYVPGIKRLSRMRDEGIRIDRDLLDQWMLEIEEMDAEAVDIIKHSILKSSTVPFNANSTKDIGIILTKVLGIPYDDLPKTDKGAISTKAEVLAHIGKNHPGTKTEEFCYYMALHNTAKTAKGNFLGGIKKLSIHDGRIHPQLKLNGTATGRLSSSEPNFQNLPGGYLCQNEFLHHETGAVIHSCAGWPIKRLLLPSNDYYVLFDMDVSAAEIRVLCGVSKDEALIKAVNDGMDVPSFIASEVFTDELYTKYSSEKEIAALPADADNKAVKQAVYLLVNRLKNKDPHIKFLRTAAKRVLYGTIYGAGAAKIASQIYGVLSSDPLEEKRQVRFAIRVQEKFFKLFKGVQKWISEIKFGIGTAQEVTSIFGRHRRFPLAKSYFRRKLNEAHRIGVNFCVQGPASDLVLSQLFEIEEAIREIGGTLLLTVHDSVVGEILASKIPLLEAFFDHWMVERVAEKFPWLPVAYTYGLDIGVTYKDSIPYEDYMSGELFTGDDAESMQIIADEIRRRVALCESAKSI